MARPRAAAEKKAPTSSDADDDDAERPSSSSSSSPHDAVVTKHAIVTLGLHPSAMDDPERGSREILDGMLMRHHDQLGGVLMSYDDVRVHPRSRTAGIIHLAGHVSLDVETTARVFCPVVGSVLRGVVNKVGVDFIGLLVLGVFNVSVGADDIRDGLVHNPAPIDDECPGGRWEETSPSPIDREHVIRVGSTVLFTVKSVSELDDVLHLIGSLTDEARTGEIGYVESVGGGGAGGG